jgi:lipid-binding SYLF domain-containing protein
MAASIRPAAAEDTLSRLQSSAAVLDKLTDSTRHGIRPDQIGNADCVAVIPGFKKGAVGVGVSFGRGFIVCRNRDNWSAPGAVTMEGGSLGVQIGGETIDIVVLSLDKDRRSKLLSDRFTIGSDASAAWGNGKSAHGDPNSKILFFAQTKGAFAGFDLDGVTLKPDDSGDRRCPASPSRTAKSSKVPVHRRPLDRWYRNLRLLFIPNHPLGGSVAPPRLWTVIFV